MDEQNKIEFTVDGMSFTCREWTIGDLLDFHEFQAKSEELAPGGIPLNPKANIEILKMGMKFIEMKTGTPISEMRGWTESFFSRVIQGIVEANQPPKAPTASSQESSTPMTELSSGRSTLSTVPST